MYLTFLGHLSFPRSGGSVDVPCALEVDVFLHSDEVRCKLPHVLSVVDDAHHGVPTREKVPVGKTDRRLRNVVMLLTSCSSSVFLLLSDNVSEGIRVRDNAIFHQCPSCFTCKETPPTAIHK